MFFILLVEVRNVHEIFSTSFKVPYVSPKLTVNNNFLGYFMLT